MFMVNEHSVRIKGQLNTRAQRNFGIRPVQRAQALAACLKDDEMAVAEESAVHDPGIASGAGRELHGPGAHNH